MQCACALLYCHLWPAALYNIFSTLSHKRKYFRKKVNESRTFVLIFSTNFIWNMSHSEKNSARYDRKCILVFMWRTRYSGPMLMNLEFYQQICEKYSNVKCHDNLSSGSRILPSEQTDGWPDMKMPIADFHNFANAPKILLISYFNK